jgi:cytochrome c biogenesis factor
MVTIISPPSCRLCVLAVVVAVAVAVTKILPLPFFVIFVHSVAKSRLPLPLPSPPPFYVAHICPIEGEEKWIFYRAFATMSGWQERIMFRCTILLILIALVTATPIVAKPADKASPKANPASVALKATVKSVTGIVEKCAGNDKNAKWQAVKTGDVLSEHTLIRTGLGAAAVLKFADRGDITVKSGTKVGISSFRKTGNLVKTTLGLKYGALRAKVDSSRGKNDFRVRTAVATLAATGTSGNMAQWGDFSLQFQGTAGLWKAKTQQKLTSVRRGEWTNRNAAKSIGLVLAKIDPKIGDPHGGLTKAEVVEQRRNPAPIKAGVAQGRTALTGKKRSRRTAVTRKLIIIRRGMQVIDPGP